MAINTTEDTLVVAVRYPLDSLLLSATELDSIRKGWWGRDSVLKQFGQPLRHVVQHGSAWYYVITPVWGMNWSIDRTNQRRGLLIYDLPPHTSQQLFWERAEGPPDFFFDPPAQAPMTGLLLRQGQHSRWVSPSQPVAEVFRLNPRKEDWLWDSSHEMQLIVGPELTLNHWFRRLWYNWWTQTPER